MMKRVPGVTRQQCADKDATVPERRGDIQVLPGDNASVDGPPTLLNPSKHIKSLDTTVDL